MSDMLPGAIRITGAGGSSSQAVLLASPGQRGYVLSCACEVQAGTATICRLEIVDNATIVYSETFQVQAAAAASGGNITFPYFVPCSSVNSDLKITAVCVGAAATSVYGIVSYGP